jgi:CO/xanthine dehydrogenase FAD-binding subunit
LKAIDYFAPTSVEEAVGLFEEKGPMARGLAGGTDIIVQLNIRRRTIERLVDIKTIPEANVLNYSPQTGLVIGAGVPCHLIYNNQAVVTNYPGLIDAASMIGGTQIQGRATIGGNVCNAAPSGDGIPPLIVLNAICVIVGPKGTRRLPVENFFTGPGQNSLEVGEFLLHIELPAPAANSGVRYKRFIPRAEMDIAVAGVGSSVILDSNKSKITSARIALASVAPTPILVKAAGALLEGKGIDDEKAIEEAATIARDAARPISDMRGTIEHRKQLVYVLTKRTLKDAIQRAKGGQV